MNTTTSQLSAAPSASELPSAGFKVLLYGGSGSGKTYSIRTLLEAGLEVFVLFTEPGMATLRDVKNPKLHMHYVKPVPFNVENFTAMLKNVNTMSFENLTKLQDPTKSSHQQMIQISNMMADFIDEKTGEHFGSLDKWDTSRVFVVDSISGVVAAAQGLVIGSRPTMSQADYGVVMNTLEKFLNMICLGVRTNVVMMAHEEREVDEVNGGTKVMASSIGKKLSPKLGRFFDDVLLAERDVKGDFKWYTNKPNYELKSRHLPLKDAQAPSFVPLVQSWKKGV